MPSKTDKQIMYKIKSMQKGKDLKSTLKVNTKNSRASDKDVSMEQSKNDKYDSIDRLPSGEQYKLMINNSQSGSSGNSDSSNHMPKSLVRQANDDLGIIREEPDFDPNQSIFDSEYFNDN